MKRDNESAIGCLAMAMLAPQAIWSGYVLSKLWLWFVVTTFEIAPLSIPAAIGVSLVVRYLTYSAPVVDKTKSSADRLFEAVIYAFITPLFALVVGSIVNLFM